MPPPTEPPACTPWWTRTLPLSHCKERVSSSEVECKYYSQITTVCKVEKQDGQNARKCQRLLRKLRDCGRGLEVTEVETEELTENNFRGSASDLQDHDGIFRVPSTSQQAGPLDANVGDAIEEFMHYAEELKHHVAKVHLFQYIKDAAIPRWAEGFSALGPDAPSSAAMMTEADGRDQQRQKQWFRRGFLTRMFAHEAQCSPGRRRPEREDMGRVCQGFPGGVNGVAVLTNDADAQLREEDAHSSK